jgi:two-component sensor histidine kinase/DNA-binding response OmpR family regulator
MNKATEFKPLRVLMIEDSKDDMELILWNIQKEGFEPSYKRVETEESLREALNQEWDIVLSDQNLPLFDGLSALKVVREKNPLIPFILISGHATESFAISVLREGANDYLFKDNLIRLGPAITRELKSFETKKKKLDAEKRIRINEQKLKQAHKLAHSGHFEYDFSSNVLRFSKELVDLLNLKTNSMSLRKFLKKVPPKDLAKLFLELKNINKDQITADLTFRIVTNNEPRYYFCRCVIKYDKNIPTDIQGVLQDITEQFLSEKILEKAIERNEFLLSEMHHRVKNNLATITSLLELENMTSNNSDTRAVLSRNTHIIYNMALIQEMLYKDSNFSSISFDKYLLKLIELIKINYFEKNEITINNKLESLDIDIIKAYPAALIAYELISNVFKHAFVNQTHKSVGIELIENNHKISLTIRDNGIGLDKNFDFKKSNTPGFMLINAFNKQLSGNLTIKSNKGVTATLKFDKQSSKQSKKFRSIESLNKTQR